MFDIKIGFDETSRKRAAVIYAQAFKGKLNSIFGGIDTIENLFTSGLNPNYCLAAYNESGLLIGLVGFHVGEHSLIDISLCDIIKELGLFKGIYRALLAYFVFERSADNPKQLLMDGIAVDTDYRGQGIATALFDALIDYAHSNHYQSIKLDVIDENPKAKLLYQRLSFTEKRHQRVPKWVKSLIGVSGVTTMVLDLNQKTSPDKKASLGKGRG